MVHILILLSSLSHIFPPLEAIFAFKEVVHLLISLLYRLREEFMPVCKLAGQIIIFFFLLLLEVGETLLNRKILVLLAQKVLDTLLEIAHPLLDQFGSSNGLLLGVPDSFLHYLNFVHHLDNCVVVGVGE